MKSLHDGLKISKKGLILVSVPLAFELIFVALLTLLLARAEYAIKREAHSKQIIYLTSTIQRKATESGMMVAVYKFTHDKKIRDRAFKTMAATPGDFAELETLIKDNPKEMQYMRDARVTSDKGTDIFTRVIAILDKDPGIKHIFSHGESGLHLEKELIDDLTNALSGLVEEERELSKEFNSNEQRARSHVQQALICGVVLNIMIALWLASFFSKSIAGRLERIIDNTSKMAKRQPLNPPLSGNDEIAQLDMALHGAVDELERAEKMKEYLLSMVSHDLRSPLTSVHAALTLLNEGAMGDLPGKAKAKIAVAELDVSRLLNLANDLLDVDRLASGNIALARQDVATQTVVRQACDAMKLFAEQHKVRLKPSGEDFDICADPDRLIQILANLLGNAIRFSAAGQEVSVSVSRVDGAARFEVADSGPGVPQASQQTIFERFTQLPDGEKTGNGKGLGLAICKSLVELHGGQIGVVSSTDRPGSTFWFTVPL